jgi:branched-subunit amino acid aminotransferase/4-amino-4-deoxychorismate lyase
MLKVLNSQEALESLNRHQVPSRKYAAMYSSWYGGIVTDPNLMLIPIDDHGFHRGDAVFEAAKAVNGKIYALDRHLDRMQISAEKIGLKLPTGLRDIAIETTRASGLKNCILRYYVSRGPGGFTTNPYESVGPQTYLVITPLNPPATAKYENGVSAKTSAIKIKEGIFSTVKSCNYLPNVMMKKEAVDGGVDFTVSVDESGVIGEGSTENFAIISKDGTFLVPSFERTLKGITLIRLMELVREDAGLKTLVKTVAHGSIKHKDVFEAREAMFLGTTLDCLPCTSFDGHKIGAGVRGEIASAFQTALMKDIASGPLALAY